MPSLQNEHGFQVCANVDAPFSALRVNLPPPEDIEVANRYVFSLVISLVGHLVDRGEAARMTFDKALTLFAGEEQQRQLVVIDQLEEALTLDPNDRQGQRELFKQLGTALRRDRRWALLAIREDYLGGLDRYRRFFPNELRTTFRLDFLDGDAALRAIQLPAQEFGVTFTDEAAHQLVSDLRRERAVSATPTRAEREDPPASGSVPGGTGEATDTTTGDSDSTPAPADPIIEEAIVYPYVEPVLLQVVCNNLWRILTEERKAAFTTIEASDLDQVRPYSRSLSNYYRAALRDAAGDDADVERAIRVWIERELVTGQKTRRPTRSLPPVEHARSVVGKLQHHYLIRDDPRPGGVFFELSHDMLVQTIVDDNNAWRRSNLKPWQIMAEEWSVSGGDIGFLLTGPAFHAAREEARRTTLGPVETDYLAASHRADADRRRRRRWAGLLIALLIVALVGAGYLWYRAEVAAEEARVAAAAAASRAYAAKAVDFVTDDPLRAIALAERGLDSARTAEAEDALRQAMSQNVPAAVLTHGGDVVSAAFSPSGDRLVTSSSDHTVRIWDSTTGKQLDLRRFDGGVQDARFSPDGKSVLALIAAGVLTIFQPDEPGGVKVLASDVGYPVAFDGGGSRVAVTDFEYALRIFDPISGNQVLPPLAGNEDTINAIEFSGDGRQVATAGQDGTARVWDASTGVLVASLAGHADGVTQVAFRADRRAIATGDGQGTVRIWPLQGNNLAPPLVIPKAQQDGSARVAFNRAGQLLAYGDRSPRIFDSTRRVDQGVRRAPRLGHRRTVHREWRTDGHRVPGRDRPGVGRRQWTGAGNAAKYRRECLRGGCHAGRGHRRGDQRHHRRALPAGPAARRAAPALRRTRLDAGSDVPAGRHGRGRSWPGRSGDRVGCREQRGHRRAHRPERPDTSHRRRHPRHLHRCGRQRRHGLGVGLATGHGRGTTKSDGDLRRRALRSDRGNPGGRR